MAQQTTEPTAAPPPAATSGFSYNYEGHWARQIRAQQQPDDCVFSSDKVEAIIIDGTNLEVYTKWIGYPTLHDMPHERQIDFLSVLPTLGGALLAAVNACYLDITLCGGRGHPVFTLVPTGGRLHAFNMKKFVTAYGSQRLAAVEPWQWLRMPPVNGSGVAMQHSDCEGDSGSDDAIPPPPPPPAPPSPAAVSRSRSPVLHSDSDATVEEAAPAAVPAPTAPTAATFQSKLSFPLGRVARILHEQDSGDGDIARRNTRGVVCGHFNDKVEIRLTKRGHADVVLLVPRSEIMMVS